MKKIMTCLLACATVLCTGVSAKGKKCEARKAKHVVLIGADGFASAVVREHPGAFPNLERLMREGSYTLERRSVLPSSSALNWASMMMGASPEIHGYTTWNSRTPELPSRVIGKYSIFPGICGLIRDSYPEAEIDCGFTWEGIGYIYERKAADVNYHASSDRALADRMCICIERNKPLFTFIAFDNPDMTGHDKGWESNEYFAMSKTIDGYVGQILDAIDRAGITEETIVIFTSDHGGTGRGHGGITMKEMESPFIVCGKGIKRGNEVDDSVMVYDCASTIAYIFSLQQPQVWIGRPVMAVFE